MTQRGVTFTREAARRTVAVVRRIDRTRSLDRGGRRRRGRGASRDPFSDVTVLLWVVSGEPGGVDGAGNPVPTTFAYRCEWPDGRHVFARVDGFGVYDPGASRRDTANNPMQPTKMRWPAIGYVPAPDGSEGTGYFNRAGDFILKSVENEIPILEVICPTP